MYFGHALLHLLFGDSLVVNNVNGELARHYCRELKHSLVCASDSVSALPTHGKFCALPYYNNAN